METRNITVPETAEYIERLYHQPDPALCRLREESESAMVPILLRETEPLLHQLMTMKRPSRILEIGTAVGYGAICFATWCPQASVTTVEYSDTMWEKARDNVEAAGLSERIHLLLGDARTVLPRLDDTFDFIFIDAGKGHYIEFWNLCLPLMAAGCVVASDNVLFKGLTASDRFEAPGKKKRKHRTITRRLRRYLDYLTREPGLMTSVLAVGDGLAITLVDHPEMVSVCCDEKTSRGAMEDYE